MSQPTPPIPYASLLRRFQALVVDLVVYAAAFVVCVLLPSAFNFGAGSTRVVVGAFLLFWCLYEPLLVGLRGATVGHRVYGLRVVDADTGRPIGVLRAFGRGVMKGLLGLVSLAFMLVTSRAQSLHDLVFRSLVVAADRTTVEAIDVIVPVTVPDSALPSRWRRLLVIVGWECLGFVVLIFVIALLVSDACVDTGVCGGGERLLRNILSGIWFSSAVLFPFLGWKGRLLGARGRG